MFTQQDLKQMADHQITVEQVEKQLGQFQSGFPYLKLAAAASIGNGILALDEAQCDHYRQVWRDYAASHSGITKFVPASGAASRMFKNMFAFVDAPYDVPTTDFEKKYFADIHKFAFFEALDEVCRKNEGKGIDELIEAGNYKAVAANMLQEKGLNYGNLPKGLLLFHNYPDGPRTPMEEHLVEAARYASHDGVAKLHFTVSHEHMPLFKAKVEQCVAKYEKMFSVRYDITFSEQKPSTDTIAVNPDNTPFRTSDGKLLFRPAGHGALIENLADLDADIVFVKNIDNVVPDRLKDATVKYKEVLAGVLIEKRKADGRPTRVCGMVRNIGEPGGGPFVVEGKDGSKSLQILESSQIDTSNKEYVEMFQKGTHFNPVDLVCSIRDTQGKPYDLAQFVDQSTGFISSKSKDGKELRALELPGLWNGAMAGWDTIFVEVPLETFNPVKTVNDLLREQHQ